MNSAPPLVEVACPLCGQQPSKFEREVHGWRLERCGGCGLIFANPRWPEEVLLGGYNDEGEHAAEVHAVGDLITYYAGLMTPAVLARYDALLEELEGRLGGPARLLDFGCGAGYFLERAQQRGWDAHGVEIGEWAQEAARMRGVRNLHQGLLSAQNFEMGSFDVVHSSQVLEHLPQPRREVGELAQLLRAGGLFYANVPNYRCLSIVLGRDDFESNHPMGHVNYFTPASLQHLLDLEGFDHIRSASYGGLKWENILGRKASRPAQPQGMPTADGTRAPEPSQAAAPSLARRLVSPVLDGLLYRQLKVGMELEIIGRKRT